MPACVSVGCASAPAAVAIGVLAPVFVASAAGGMDDRTLRRHVLRARDRRGDGWFGGCILNRFCASLFVDDGERGEGRCCGAAFLADIVRRERNQFAAGEVPETDVIDGEAAVGEESRRHAELYLGVSFEGGALRS